jgi:hypothetical protein
LESLRGQFAIFGNLLWSFENFRTKMQNLKNYYKEEI